MYAGSKSFVQLLHHRRRVLHRLYIYVLVLNMKFVATCSDGSRFSSYPYIPEKSITPI